jgi:hypothetical protein
MVYTIFQIVRAFKMKANSTLTISKRIIIFFLIALLAFSAFNTFLILERTSGPVGAVPYNFVISKAGNDYQLKNMLTGSTINSGSVSSILESAFDKGNSVYLNAGTYTLTADVNVSNKINAKIVGDQATIIGNGHKITIRGDNYTSSQYATISGLTIINGIVRIENSFGTTISKMIFENTSVGIEIANTNTWSENTKIEDCNFFNATEGIVFRTPPDNATGSATGSYASSQIDRCFFNLRDNSVAINVEPLAEFSDSQMQDVRMWMGEDGVTNQTGLLLDGTMTQSLLIGVVFESFTDQPNNIYAIDIGQTAKYPPILFSGVSFLGNFTAMTHNPYNIWISGASTAFERQDVNVPVGLNGQYGTNTTIQTDPLKIFNFTPKIQVTGDFQTNEIVTVRIRLEFIDNVISAGVAKAFTNSSSIWLSNDDLMQLYPSQDIILAIVVDAQSSSSSSNVGVTVSGYGTAG